jgi:hypothetical protein
MALYSLRFRTKRTGIIMRNDTGPKLAPLRSFASAVALSEYTERIMGTPTKVNAKVL